MNIKKLSFCLTFLSMLLFPIKNFGQTSLLDLGALDPFSIYTAAGAVANIGNTKDTGNIGTDFGIISGFDTTIFGSSNNSNNITVQAKIDLLNVYILLNNIRVTNTKHAPAFGSETLKKGVYLIASAGSLAGTLILDGEGDSSASFIFKFQGAFTTSANSTIVLSNGTRPSNVFWISEGAISTGTTSKMKGTLIAHPGAVTLGAGSSLDGRMFSTSGAITCTNALITKPDSQSLISIECVNTNYDTYLKTAANFTLFSSAGAVANTGISGVIGNIGSNFGAVSGWGSSVVVGSIHNANSITAQAKTDLAEAYNKLINVPATNSTHTAAFGNGETLTHGVYKIAGAGSLAGTLILDGGGDTNTLFIFKFEGAFGTATGSRVIFTNGTRRSNVFWLAEGAISMAAFTVMRGTTIANNGANNMGANGFIEGRMLSTGGAVGFNTATTFIGYSLCGTRLVPSDPPTDPALPIELISFTGKCENENTTLRWSTASELNNNFFTIERSIGGVNWEIVGIIDGAGNSNEIKYYSYLDTSATKNINYYYKLKQTDYDNKFEYSHPLFVKKCGNNESQKFINFPNPSKGKFTMTYIGNDIEPKIYSTEIFNSWGQKVYESNGSQTKFDLSSYRAGIYFTHTYLASQVVILKIIITD